MTLEDLKTNPLLLTKSIKITGPGGLKGTRSISAVTPVITPNSFQRFEEKVTLIPDAVTTGRASVNDLGDLISVSRDGAANCYWLPWGSGKLYVGQLGGDHSYFFTYTINGCGVIIGGSETTPIVGHANLDSDRLTNAALSAAAAIQKNPKNMASANQKAAKDQALVYEQFYGNLAAQMIHDELMSGARLEVVTPQQYLIDANASFGAVFGLQDGGRWKFYGNWASQTRQIWP